MSSWARRAISTAASWFGRKHRHSSRPRRVSSRLSPTLSGLESRQCMSTGVGGSLPIQSLPARVEVANQLDNVQFELRTGTVVTNRGIPMLLAFQVTPAPGSAVQPQIRRVGSLAGLSSLNVVNADGPLFTQITVPSTSDLGYQANVLGLDDSIGNYLLTAYLPGDTNYDGVVDRVDAAAVRNAYGSSTGSSNYNPQADMDNNGVVGQLDLILTNRNLGARSNLVSLKLINSDTTTIESLSPTARQLITRVQGDRVEQLLQDPGSLPALALLTKIQNRLAPLSTA